MKIKRILTVLAICCVAITSFLVPTVDVQASPSQQIDPWCGSTSETENYGFTFPLQQAHWTVNADRYVSSAAIDEIDVLYDKLNNDNIANTMVLFLDSRDISNGPNCAGHFLMYMKLGNADGPRMANGMAILFTVTEENGLFTGVKVNYSVGGSLNALQPYAMKEMDIIAQDAFTKTGSLTETYLAVMRYFEEYARSVYEPYYPPTVESAPATQGQAPSIWSVLLCLTCLVMLAVLLIVVGGLGGNGGGGTRSSNWSPSSSPSSSRRSSSSPSSPRSSPPSRGGSGSGNTNRTG